MTLWKDFIRGIWPENPSFRMLIGMCPVLAVTSMAVNGLAMGLSVTFVLVCSSVMISLVRNLIPSKVRIPCYIVIIATFVTIIDLVLAAIFPEIHKVLGIFIPLIVVNCIILGRAEAFASKNPVINSIFDALGMGLGTTWAMTFLGIIREFLGMGTIFGQQVLGEWFTPFIIMVLPPGAFIALGIILGIINTALAKRSNTQDCR